MLEWVIIALVVLAVAVFLYMYLRPNRQLYMIVSLHLLWIAAFLGIFLNDVTVSLVAGVVWLFLTACLQVYWRVVYYGLCARGNGDYKLWSAGMKSIFNSSFRVERCYHSSREESEIPISHEVKAPYDHPVIYALPNNHASDFFEILALPLVSEDAVIVSASTSKPIQDIIRNNTIFVDTKVSGNFERVSQEMVATLRDNKSIIVFPENGKTARKKKDSGDTFAWWRQAGSFQSGAFKVAITTGVPIVPVVIEKYAFSEGFPWIGSTIRVHFLEPIRSFNDDLPFEEAVEWMRDEYALRLQTFLSQI